MKNTAHVDFTDKILNNVCFSKVNSIPTLEQELTTKIYVDQAISDGVDISSLLKLHPDEKLNLDEQDSIVVNPPSTLKKTQIELPTKSYVKSFVDSRWNYPSIIKNTAHVDFNDKNLDSVRSIKVNSLPGVREHLTPKFYVDEAFSYWLDDLSLLRLDPNETLKLDEQDSIIPNSTLTIHRTTIELPTKSYVDSLHENSRIRRDVSSSINDQKK